MTPREVQEAVDSLRSTGGVYEYVAACVQWDNRPDTGALAADDLDALSRFGLTPQLIADPSLIKHP